MEGQELECQNELLVGFFRQFLANPSLFKNKEDQWQTIRYGDWVERTLLTQKTKTI